MPKSEVYSWRTDPEMKSALEEAARSKGVSVARLLERIVAGWLARLREESADQEAEQRRLHEAAAKCIGRIQGDDPRRGKEVRERVRKKLTGRHGA